MSISFSFFLSFFLSFLFHYFKIILRQTPCDCFILLLFNFTSYSTTQKHEIHQQVKKEGRGGVDCKYYITYEQWYTMLLIWSPLPTHVFSSLLWSTIIFSFIHHISHTHTHTHTHTHKWDNSLWQSREDDNAIATEQYNLHIYVSDKTSNLLSIYIVLLSSSSLSSSIYSIRMIVSITYTPQ